MAMYFPFFANIEGTIRHLFLAWEDLHFLSTYDHIKGGSTENGHLIFHRPRTGLAASGDLLSPMI